MLTKNLVIVITTTSLLACGQRPIVQGTDEGEPTIGSYAGKLVFSRPSDVDRDGDSWEEQLFVADWSGENVEQVATPESLGHFNGVSRSEDGQSLTVATHEGLFSIDETGKATQLPIGHVGWQDPSDPSIRGLMMDGALINSPDGGITAFGSTSFDYAYMTVLHVVDATGGEPQIFTNEGKLLAQSTFNSIVNFVSSPLYTHSFVWADEGKTLIAAQSDKLVSVSTVGERLKILSAGYEYANAQLAISPDGEYLALNRRNIGAGNGRDIYRVRVADLLASNLLDPDTTHPTLERITFDQDNKQGLAYGPNGLVAVTSLAENDSTTLRIIDTQSGDTVATIEGVRKVYP
jgi:WD40 repeat protein